MYIVGTYIYTHTYILAHVVEATLTHHHLLVQYTFCCWIKPFNANSHGSRMGSHSPHMCHLNTSQSILGGHTVFNPYQFIVPLYNTPMLKMSKHPPLRDFCPPSCYSYTIVKGHGVWKIIELLLVDFPASHVWWHRRVTNSMIYKVLPQWVTSLSWSK